MKLWILTDTVTGETYRLKVQDEQLYWEVSSEAAVANPVVQDTAESGVYWELTISDGQLLPVPSSVERDDTVYVADDAGEYNYRIRATYGTVSWEKYSGPIEDTVGSSGIYPVPFMFMRKNVSGSLAVVGKKRFRFGLDLYLIGLVRKRLDESVSISGVPSFPVREVAQLAGTRKLPFAGYQVVSGVRRESIRESLSGVDGVRAFPATDTLLGFVGTKRVGVQTGVPLSGIKRYGVESSASVSGVRRTAVNESVAVKGERDTTLLRLALSL